ncbi:MAG: hypothetical protein HY648_01240 [Acidobacteria bacterium]|nr:hypothetical protein [Acidobacteriota bacterium]
MRKFLIMLLMLGLPGIACTQQSEEQRIVQEQQEEQPLTAQDEATTPRESDMLIAEGSLSRVDSDGKFLWIKTSDGKELQFSYDDDTEMVEGETVEGLANKSGSELKVHYRVEGGNNIATRIEVGSQRT